MRCLKGPILREKWVKAVSPLINELKTTHKICEKHFKQSDIVRHFIHKDGDGQIIAQRAMLTRFYLPVSRQARQITTKKKVKLSVNMNEEIHRLIDNEELKPRKHPGRLGTQLATIPDWLAVGVQNVLQDMPIPAILEDSKKLANFLHGRHAPAEVSTVRAKYTEIRNKIAADRNPRIAEIGQPEEIIGEQTKERKKCLTLLKQSVHAWSPVKYNRYAGLLHLVSRSAAEYAVLHRILREIGERNRDFRPKTLLDFGSGLGTATWVTSSIWPKAVKEHICIDASTDMHELAESLIEHARPKIDRIFYRQYIPLSNRNYDIVVSAYTLLELPNMQTRLDTIAKLWERTERYLVIVEQGTNAGFKLINEARDFILHMQRARTETDSRSYVFSPCPHQFACPRYKTDDTPCNFEVPYTPFTFKNTSSKKIERYSYVVFKKDDSVDVTKNWPRIVRPTIVRSGHTICRMCTADGKLNEIIFTATKHGKWMYRCARSSKWGDRLPAETSVDNSPDKEREEEARRGHEEAREDEEEKEEYEEYEEEHAADEEEKEENATYTEDPAKTK